MSLAWRSGFVLRNLRSWLTLCRRPSPSLIEFRRVTFQEGQDIMHVRSLSNPRKKEQKKGNALEKGRGKSFTFSLFGLCTQNLRTFAGKCRLKAQFPSLRESCSKPVLFFAQITSILIVYSPIYPSCGLQVLMSSR